MPYMIDVIAYQVDASVDEAGQLLLLFKRDGEDVWGCVIRGWREGEAEIVETVGYQPYDVNWGMASAIGTARENADQLPLVQTA